MPQSDRRAASSAFAQLVLEELSRRTEPAVARAILTTSLERAGVAEIPPDTVGFGLFVCGPLLDVAESAVGFLSADAVVRALSPFFSGVDDGESAVRRNEARVLAGQRLLVVVSADARRASRVSAHVRGRLEVREVRDLFGLLRMAESHTDRRLVVLVDGDIPGTRGSGLATMARVLPPTTEVVFWGPTTLIDLPMTVRILPKNAGVPEVVDSCLEEEPVETPIGDRPVVVLVDDEPLWRKSLERALKREGGFDVVTCTNGFEALEACIDHRPALLITDLEMALLDGAQLAALVRARFGDASPRVVMLTGAPPEPIDDVDAMITKGGRISEILETLRPYLPDGSSST